MSIFILSMAITYVLSGIAPSPKTFATLRSEHAWLRVAWIIGTLTLAAALIMLLIKILIALESSSLNHPYYERIQHVAQAPETAQAILGLVAGVILRKFPFWVLADDPAQESKASRQAVWQLAIISAAVVALLTLALLAPGAQTILSRITGLEAPGLSIQLAASAPDRQLAISVDRGIAWLDTIDDLPRASRFFQYDCGYALVAGGKLDRQNFPSLDDFKNEIGFRQSSSFAKFVNQVINAKTKGADIEILKSHVRPVAVKLSQLAEEPQRDDEKAFDDAYDAAVRELEKQKAALSEENQGIPDSSPEIDQKFQKHDPDPTWCGDGSKDPEKSQLRDVINYTRGFYGFVAGLEGFIGDVPGQILMYSIAKTKPLLANDINVNEGLAASLYFGGEPIGKVVPLIQVALGQLEREAAKVREAPPTDISDKLTKRYDRGRIDLQGELAYLWALESLRPEEKVWPEESVPLPTAELYAEAAYDRSRKDSTVRFECVDDDQAIFDEDTYALVKLAIQANNVQTRAAALNQEELYRARSLLENARARVTSNASPCVLQRVEVWARRIDSHLRLAESMLR